MFVVTRGSKEIIKHFQVKFRLRCKIKSKDKFYFSKDHTRNQRLWLHLYSILELDLSQLRPFHRLKNIQFHRDRKAL